MWSFFALIVWGFPREQKLLRNKVKKKVYKHKNKKTLIIVNIFFFFLQTVLKNIKQYVFNFYVPNITRDSSVEKIFLALFVCIGCRTS